MCALRNSKRRTHPTGRQQNGLRAVTTDVVFRRRRQEVSHDVPERIRRRRSLLEGERAGSVGGAGSEAVAHRGHAAVHLCKKPA